MFFVVYNGIGRLPFVRQAQSQDEVQQMLDDNPDAVVISGGELIPVELERERVRLGIQEDGKEINDDESMGFGILPSAPEADGDKDLEGGPAGPADTAPAGVASDRDEQRGAASTA